MSVAGDRSGRQAGFTLLEMLVTIGILSLIVGIAFPAVQRLTARQQAAAARSAIVAALVGARAAAIAGDRTATVTLAPDRTALLVGRRAIAVPPALRLTWPAQGIAFYPDGTATGSAVRLATGTRVMRFAVDGPTAGISVTG